MLRDIKRILITGAAGGIGTMLRKEFAFDDAVLRFSDKVNFDLVDASHEKLIGDLSDPEFALELTIDVDAVFHFGGKSIEGPFQEILNANIVGLYNLYEGCRKNGVRRVAYASSNHVVGFHKRTSVVDTHCVTRPDSNYGVSKVFGEGVAQLYWDKYGLETVSIRIGSCLPEPLDMRMLSTWISPRDMRHLLMRCLTALSVEHTVIYGVSDNDEKLWDNGLASHLGYRPVDNSEQFREKLRAREPELDRYDPAYSLHGGSFAAAGHFEDQE